jgi:DNA repair protein RecN (Recombination protein N)
VLEEIRISSMGVIDDATVEFRPGLNVVTGETGAGKTMVVTALMLLLGARGDSGLVRSSATRARIEGRVKVEPGSPLARRADDSGADLDDGSLILARTISTEGR